jgi:carboxyl-terminal processing protease
VCSSDLIQDWDRGLIVGTTTFGKGLVQSILPLGAEEALKITTAKYYTPSGRCIQKDEKIEGQQDEGKKSEKEPYHTKAGRIVYGGGGISPDVALEAPTLTRFESELMRHGVFMGFAASYTFTHSQIHKDFEVTEEMMAAFKQFIEEKKIQYDAAGVAEIAKLREISQKEQYSQAVDRLLLDLDKQVEVEKEKDFDRSRKFIQDQLKAQIALDLWGSEEETMIRLQDDPQVVSAMDLLKHLDQYFNNLAASPQGE